MIVLNFMGHWFAILQTPCDCLVSTLKLLYMPRKPPRNCPITSSGFQFNQGVVSVEIYTLQPMCTLLCQLSGHVNICMYTAIHTNYWNQVPGGAYQIGTRPTSDPFALHHKECVPYYHTSMATNKLLPHM